MGEASNQRAGRCVVSTVHPSRCIAPVGRPLPGSQKPQAGLLTADASRLHGHRMLESTLRFAAAAPFLERSMAASLEAALPSSCDACKQRERQGWKKGAGE